jgi:hypothetical protein
MCTHSVSSYIASMPATEPADSKFEEQQQSVTAEDTARLQLCHIAIFFDLCVCTVRIISLVLSRMQQHFN